MPWGSSLIDTIVFDLGGVLVDWNPRYVFTELFPVKADMEEFLATVCNHDWNEKHDAGQPFAVGVRELSAVYPEKSALIQTYRDRWPDMLRGEIAGTVKILEELHSFKSVRLLALSNWSAETFPVARERFEFLKLFETVLVSGEEKLIKPDPKFFNLLRDRHGVDFSRTLFVDDVEKNVSAARDLGFNVHHFESPEKLRRELSTLAVLPLESAR
jgi:2-haloacid dehalogenase